MTASLTKLTRSRPASRPQGRRRAQFNLETLEGRDLKSGIPGVTNQWGMISIQGTMPAGNSVSVSIDPDHNDDLRVTLNGESAWFNASEVWTIGYNGSQGGSDTFVNDTNITSSIIGYGGNNTFYGGGGYDSIYVYGDYNTIDTREGAGYIEAHNGPNNTIVSSSEVYVQTFSYDTSWFWW